MGNELIVEILIPARISLRILDDNRFMILNYRTADAGAVRDAIFRAVEENQRLTD